MQTIETTAEIGDDRKLTVQLPLEVAPGRHQIVVVVESPPHLQSPRWTMADWPIHDAALVDPNFTMRREEVYGDDGR